MAIQHYNMGEGVIGQYDWLNCAFGSQVAIKVI